MRRRLRRRRRQRGYEHWYRYQHRRWLGRYHHRYGLVGRLSTALALPPKPLDKQLCRYLGDLGDADHTPGLARDGRDLQAGVATRLDGKDLNVRLAEAGNQDSGEGILAEMLNPKVQVYGDVAILSYNYLGMTKDKDGNTETTRAKSTRVYVKQGATGVLQLILGMLPVS